MPNINEKTKFMQMLEPDTRSKIKELTRSMVQQREKLHLDAPIDFEEQAQILLQFGVSLAAYEDVNDPDMTAALFAYDRLRQAMSKAFTAEDGRASTA